MPVCGVLLWATGGANSYAIPLLILPLFFLAYFYPPRWAWSLVTLLVLVAGSPVVYDPAAVEGSYPGRWLTLGVAWSALTGVVVWLKRRLVEAEQRQRTMALSDALTGLGNRRAFDAALQSEVVRAGELTGDRTPIPTALAFVDLDRFKEMNDLHGHTAGDRVLRAVAERCAAAVRPGDTVAPAPDAEPISATVSYALLGEDGRNAAELLRAADRRLHDAKRARRADGARTFPVRDRPVLVR